MENFEQYPQQDRNLIPLSDWVISLILLCIPLVNIIMLCIWAFGGSAPPTKANFAKASLILMAIGILISIIFSGLIFGALFSALSGL